MKVKLVNLDREVIDYISENGGGQPSGFPINAAFNFNVHQTGGQKRIEITWSDPDDIIVEGVTLGEWGGSRLVRKVGSEPDNENDGTIILNNSVKNQYSSEPFIDTNIDYNVDYYYAIFTYNKQGLFDKRVVSNKITPKEYVLYGVRIKKNEADPDVRVEYIHDAVGKRPAKMNFSTGSFDYGDWGDVWFVKDNYPVMLNPDGTEAYKINPYDYSKKLDGTSSNIDSTTHLLNAMSRIPLVWLKQYEDDTYEYIIISNGKVDDDFKAYAHTDESGIIKDSLYLSIYKGHLLNNKLRSLSGKELSVSTTANSEITYATSNGSKFNIRSWSQRNLINSLLTLISKNDNGQKTFGNGNINSSGKLNTGTLDTKGQFYGSESLTSQVKIFHIEGWWGDIWDRLNGLLNINGVVKTKMIPPYNFIGTNFSDVGVRDVSSGYIKSSKMSDKGRIPNVTGGSDITYQADYAYFNNSITAVAIVGGHWTAWLNAGPSPLNLSFTASASYTHIGAGLSVI